ncbi:FKBP-type peptidyl-prolyl cis-trans isomerase [Synechococcus sp. HK05]|uniref:FKBP-type peptidyl-prolyl cis-trans isomerase n=1 Tax=Synechococcus sp. HK05 TaxID=2725975 RepID=UPI001C38D397|nr:FKBP-type peptidyl-prolyl cis-trans isomerase [Synechococcus sp. HK05]MBV2352167.1 FKBP-type peptidyl-prolyl cis-trans isomerase [Synechococcus sp. HK05]
MQRELLRASTGVKIQSGDKVFVRYEGRLTNGDLFDGNFNFSTLEPVEGRDFFSFVLGAGQVIQGWEKGLEGAALGQVIKLEIPPELAYGSTERPGIPANSTLVFTVEVVGYSDGNASPAVAYGLEDLGISLSKYGLNKKITKRISAAKIGLDTNETIIGTPGKDLLTGLGGSNVIAGGLSGDVLISTKGADIFSYETIQDSLPSKKSRDIIAGFSKNDRIDLTEVGEDIEFTYIRNQKLTGKAGEIQYSKGIVNIDLDGNKKSDIQIELVGSPRIGFSAFII